MFLFNRKHIIFINSFLILFLFFSATIFPQLYLRGIAPLSPGNYWKYKTTYDGINYIDSVGFLVKDSIVKIDNRDYFMIEVRDVPSISYIYCGLSADSFYIRFDEAGEDSIYKYLKYNCHLGDTWNQRNSQNNIIFSVIDTFAINAWGKICTAKVIYLTSDNGFLQMYFLWTDSLGLLSEFSESEYRADLVGCVINGQLYGDTAMYVTSVKEIEEPPQEFILMQNYPNPFNPFTKITYYIPYSTDVRLMVYNTLGEEIETLVDEFQNSGTHSVKFKGNDLPSGVYIYRLTAGDYSAARKLLLLK